MPHVVLINPNTNRATTERMVEIAREAAGGRFTIGGLTATHGVGLITNEKELAAATLAVRALAAKLPANCDGIILSAFGDPGLAELRRRTRIPIAGIGEAGLLAAADGGRRFAIATTTPGLRSSIETMIADLGLSDRYVGTEITEGSPAELTADHQRLETALAAAITRAIDVGGAQAVVIGGGPLAVVARRLAGRFSVPIIEPIPEAVRRLERALLDRK